MDAYVKLYDYGARFYDPALGRFISADIVVPNPDNAQSFNRYSYCLNNPLRYVDPTGYDEKDFYVFVQGGDLNEDWWDTFLDELGKHLGFDITSSAWTDWKNEHVGYTSYQLTGDSVEAKAQDFSNWLQNNADIQKWAEKFPSGGIHLIGHSMGGLVIMEYLRDLEHGAASAPKQGIKSVSVLDAPLDNAPGIIGFRRYGVQYNRTDEYEGLRRVTGDRLGGLGSWAKDQKIVVVTVSYSQSPCNHSQVDAIPHSSLPGGTNQPGWGDVRGKHAYVVEGPVDSGSFEFLWDHNALR